MAGKKATTIITAGIISAIAIMALLVVATNLSTNDSSNNPVGSTAAQEQGIKQFQAKLDLESLFHSNGGVLVASNIKEITIQNTGQGSFIETDKTGIKSERQFSVDSEDLKSIENMVTQTGFMEIPSRDYPAKPESANYTQYSLTVQLGDQQQKTFKWVNPEASQSAVPPIITKLAEQMQELARG